MINRVNGELLTSEQSKDDRFVGGLHGAMESGAAKVPSSLSYRTSNDAADVLSDNVGPVYVRLPF